MQEKLSVGRPSSNNRSREAPPDDDLARRWTRAVERRRLLELPPLLERLSIAVERLTSAVDRLNARADQRRARELAECERVLGQNVRAS